MDPSHTSRCQVSSHLLLWGALVCCVSGVSGESKGHPTSISVVNTKLANVGRTSVLSFPNTVPVGVYRVSCLHSVSSLLSSTWLPGLTHRVSSAQREIFLFVAFLFFSYPLPVLAHLVSSLPGLTHLVSSPQCGVTLFVACASVVQSPKLVNRRSKKCTDHFVMPMMHSIICITHITKTP